MSDGLSAHCVDTTDVVAADTAHTEDVLSADATGFMSAHTTLSFPRKVNVLATELFDPTCTMLSVMVWTAMPLIAMIRRVPCTEFKDKYRQGHR